MALKTGWRSRLQTASFRGVPFSVENDASEFGRRVQVHEYPNRDKPYTEDLGRATRRIQINAYLIGDDYPEQRDRLIAAIETQGAAMLVHPYYGEMKGSVDGTVRVTHGKDEGRMCRVSFSFVESGELSFPTAGVATGQRLESVTDSLGDALNGALSAFSLDGLSDFISSGILEDGATMLGTVAEVFKMVDAGVSASMRLLQGDLSVVLSPPSTASDFVSALQKAWRGGSRLYGDASDLVTMVKTISGVTLDPGLAPRGVWETDSGSTVTRRRQANLLSEAVRVTAIAEAAYAVTRIPSPPRAGKVQDNSTPTYDIVAIPHAALDSVNDAETVGQPATWDDLVDIRTGLNQAIDREQLRTTDDAVFLALTKVRAEVNRDISLRLVQVEKTATRTPPEILPALVLAADWYDDARRETDIIYRNTITHPGFVPVRPLRVPIR